MKNPTVLPLISVRDVVYYPRMQKTLFVGRDFTIRAITHAKRKYRGRLIALTQTSVEEMEPFDQSDSYTVGTVCRILQSVLLTDGTMRVHLESLEPIRLNRIEEKEGVRFALGTLIGGAKTGRQRKVSWDRQSREAFLSTLVRWDPRITFQETSRFDDIKREESFDRFLDIALEIASHPASVPTLGKRINTLILRRQRILEEQDRGKQFQLLSKLLKEEL